MVKKAGKRKTRKAATKQKHKAKSGVARGARLIDSKDRND
jgi:hypothetical protein